MGKKRKLLDKAEIKAKLSEHLTLEGTPSRHAESLAFLGAMALVCFILAWYIHISVLFWVGIVFLVASIVFTVSSG